ncbi:MAG: helix-turn-helix domain-containing protein [Candidatus Berkiellales bacterium]
MFEQQFVKLKPQSISGNCHIVSSEQIQFVFSYPQLSDGEKVLWLWLAQHSINDPNLYCYFSYQQISLALNKKWDTIHRALVRLRFMGFVQSDLPVLHGEVTIAASIVRRTYMPSLPGEEWEKYDPPTEENCMQELPREKGIYRRPPILDSLLLKKNARSKTSC